MEFVLIFAVLLAVAHGGHSPPPAAECPSLNDGRSLIASMLNLLGFNDTCIAAALEFCSSAGEDGDLHAFIKTIIGMEQQNHTVVNKPEARPRHCKDLLDSGDSGSGLRQVYPYHAQPDHNITVYCDQEVDGGGWTVFQRRDNNAVRQDFFRSWREYQLGFGDISGEFWLGLDHLHQLASTEQELRIDLYDHEGQHRWAKYGTFQVGPEDTNYRLTVKRYSGDAGDSMTGHNGQEFTTHDADHDKHSSTNCAEEYRGAWWYISCHNSNLNGYRYVGDNSPYGKGIVWYHWRGYYYSLMRTTMMLRPAP